jgi:multimeric flavodoxin WrbA
LSTQLLEEAIRGAKSKGAEVVCYDLNAKGIRGCQGCGACRKDDARACVQDDPLKPMYKDLAEADGVLLSAPIYMGTVTAQVWILINRLYAAIGQTPRFPGKNYALLVTQGNPNLEAFRPAVKQDVQDFFDRLSWKNAGDLFITGTAATDEQKAKAFALGEAVVK